MAHRTHRLKARHSLKARVGQGILALASIALSLLVTEAILRFAGSTDLGLAIYPRGYFVADTELGYDIAGNAEPAAHGFYQVFSNSLRCFDYDRPVEDLYTLVVGDSFAWGYTPLPSKWTTVVEARSRQFVLKCGVSGFGCACNSESE
ncbi:MAG: hypothetical protein ACT4QD_21690 [Acidobacteriota bacterium]